MKKENKTYHFPKGFYWGSATSAQQTEGKDEIPRDGKSETIWEKSFKEMEERFFEGKFTKNNFLEEYSQDLKIAKKLNFNSLRISLSWSRLIPDGKNINLKAVKFYNNVFDEMKKNNLEIFVGLYHFDMPMWANDMGGWLSDEVVKKFSQYSKVAYELFGSKVKKWVTFNEPIVLVEGQFWYDFHYPFEVDFKKGIIAMFNIIKAHSLAVEEFRKTNLKTEIGIILNITPAIPRSNNIADKKASKIAELFQWRCFSDSMLKGKFPIELIKLIKEKGVWPEKIDIKKYNEIFNKSRADFLGINYYSPLRVKSLDSTPNFNEEDSAVTPHTHFYQTYEMPGRRMNIYRGWEIHPESIYTMLKTIQNEYENIPCYISENGMGVQNEDKFRKNGVIQDSYRIEFLTEHLYWIHKAIQEGSSCFGYHMWTYIDNWSWLNGYKNRYGFVELNIKTNERKEKLSASWIREVIDTNSIKF